PSERALGTGRSGLAHRTPVGGAVGVPLSSRFDWRPAAAATPARAVVDQASFSAGLDRGGHQLVGCLEHGAELLVLDLGDGAPGRDARLPERRRLREISASGDEAPLEQTGTDGAAGTATRVGDW